jgi:uncharacterized protein
VNNHALIGSRLHLIAIILCCAWAVADGEESKWVPKLDGWVNDTANVLSDLDRKRLADMLSRYHEETFHQLVVLTVPTVSGEGIESFSVRVANSWQLGYKGLDNGILVTLAMKERTVRVELGKGMERYISDATVKSIIDSSMTPAFAHGDIAGGLERGLNRLMDEARRFVVKTSDLPPRGELH